MYSIEKIKKDLKDRVSEYRYEHSLMVADEAKNLAKKYNLDEDKAYVAGLVHDIVRIKSQNNSCRCWGCLCKRKIWL